MLFLSPFYLDDDASFYVNVYPDVIVHLAVNTCKILMLYS